MYFSFEGVLWEADYFERKNNFDWWSDAFNQMDWLPGGGLNNAYEAIDRHVKNGFGDRVAMIWVGKKE